MMKSLLPTLFSIFFLQTTFSKEHIKTVCTQHGIISSYDCTVNDSIGIGSTIWLGDSFECMQSSNQIRLFHPSFSEFEVISSCGNFSARSIGVTGSEYTSRLTFRGDLNLNGATINCTLSNAHLQETVVIIIGDTPFPPGPLMFALSSDSLMVSWSPPSGPMEGGVGGYMFNVTGDGCGCVSMNVSSNTTNVTCSGWTAAGQTCLFKVRTLSQDCEFRSSQISSSITFSVPRTPQNLAVESTYNKMGIIEKLLINFDLVDTPGIGAHIDPTVSYIISLTGPNTLQYTDVTCNSTTNRCTLIVNGSLLIDNERYSVSVKAVNAIGSGVSTYFSNQIFTDIVQANIIKLKIDKKSSIVVCHLLNSYIETNNVVCSITYGKSLEQCERYHDSSIPTIGRPGANLTIILSQHIDSNKEFCYTVSVKYGITTIKIAGSLTLSCRPSTLGYNPSSQTGAGSVMVDNGVIIYDGVAFGSTAHLVCNEGYTAVEGTSDRICLRGTWSGNPQLCGVSINCSCDVSLTMSTVLTLLLTLGLGTAIGVLSVLGWQKCCTKLRGNNVEKSFSRSPPYDGVSVPVVPKDNQPQTNANPSYEHMHVQSPIDRSFASHQRSTELWPLHEDPNHNTQTSENEDI